MFARRLAIWRCWLNCRCRAGNSHVVPRERGGGTLVCSSPPRRRRPGHTHTGAHTAAAAPALLIAVAPPRGSVLTSVHRHPPSATHHRGVPVHHTAHHHRERAERCAVLPAYGGHSRRRLAFARVWIVGWAAEARCRIRARRGSERHPRGASAAVAAPQPLRRRQRAPPVRPMPVALFAKRYFPSASTISPIDFRIPLTSPFDLAM